MWKKRAFAPKLFVYRREIKGSETFFRLILSEKNWFQIKTTHRLSISDINILLLTRKIGKPYKVCNFLLTQWTKFLPFFKVGAWCTAKTCTCLLRFSILQYGTTDSKWRYRWCHFVLFHSSLSNSLFVYAIKSKLHGNPKNNILPLRSKMHSLNHQICHPPLQIIIFSYIWKSIIYSISPCHHVISYVTV